MSKVAELAYDIEQLYIEGYSPKSIAMQLGCPLTMIYDWLEDNSLSTEEVDDTQQGDYQGA
jgi:DNA-directed RNA polymerase specialized sigma24 family protein